MLFFDFAKLPLILMIDYNCEDKNCNNQDIFL